MGQGKAYPEVRDIRAIVVLLATQGLIRLGEVPDPLSGKAGFDAEGAKFYLDLLLELERKTRNNLLADESAFLAEVLANLRQALAGKTGADHGG